MACETGEHSLTAWIWKWQDVQPLIEGEYWAMTDRDRDDKVVISRISQSKEILESSGMLTPCTYFTFSTGHKIYVTNIVAGWTPSCRITVYPPEEKDIPEEPEEPKMSEDEFECDTSGNLQEGDSFFHDACVIDVLSIIDTDHVSVRVYPLYEGAVYTTLLQNQETNFRDFQVPFRVTATTIFDSDTNDFCVLKVCKLGDEPEPEPTGYIGEITYDPIADIIYEDEIIFTIPVTNVDTVPRWFYVEAFVGDEKIAKEPDLIYKTMLAGLTEDIIITSKGAIYPTSWSLETVRGKDVRFELRSSTNGVFGFDVVDTKIVSVEADIDPEPDEKPVIPVMPDLPDVLPEENLKIVNSDYPQEAGYFIPFRMKFEIDNLNAILPVKAIAKLFDKTSGSIITEKEFEVKAGENYILDLPGIIYSVTKEYMNYRLVILQDRMLLSDEIEDALDFSVRNSDYVDPDDPTLERCEQAFKILYDEVAVPGTVVVAGGEVPISVEGGSITLIKGKEYIATAYHKLGNETKTFTSCTLKPIVFGLKSEPDPDEDEVDSNLIIYLAVFIAALLMMRSG